MAELQKAKLQEVEANAEQKPIGDPVPVQFNPASLKLRISNQSDGGRSLGRQRRQKTGQSSTVLSMDLIFDTADEGTEAEPVSVRSKTREVERFVLPKEAGGETPPRLQFQWDKLIIAGIVESLDIDFDHFAENGAPLRAKMSLSIKEQEPKYTLAKADKRSTAATKPGANNKATNPGGGTNQPGASKPAGDRSATALDGETAADFLARQGLDPAAWRGLDIDLSAGLSLEAGLEVGFSAGLSVSAGVGVKLGAQASVGVSLEASLGLGAAAGGGQAAAGSASSASTAGAGKKVDGDSAGLALAAAGGIQAAIATVKMQQVGTAAAATQAAFGLPKSANGAASGPATTSRATTASSAAATRSSASGSMSTGSTTSASANARAGHSSASATTTPVAAVDARATSYGFGVPLRPQYAAALSQTSITLCQPSGGSSRRDDGGPAFARQKITPPWIQLPQQHQSRNLADSSELKKSRHPCNYSYHPCDCKGD